MRPANKEGLGLADPDLPKRIATTTFQIAGGEDTAQGDLLAYAEAMAANARGSGAAAALRNGQDDPDTELTRQELNDLIASGESFTTDDLSHPAGRGIIGALILQASTRGRIVSVGRTRSKRVQAHGRKIDIWRGVP